MYCLSFVAMYGQRINIIMYRFLDEAYVETQRPSGEARANWRGVHVACGCIDIFCRGTYMVKFWI